MRRKQWLAVLLAVTMAGSMMPTTVRAAEADNLTAEQKNETEENKEPEEKTEESKELTEESEEQKTSTEAKQDSEKEETSEEVTGEPKEEAKEELSGETSKEGTPQESMDEKQTPTEESQAPKDSEEKNTQEQENSSMTITEEKISEEPSTDAAIEGQQEPTETIDETTEEQTPEEELKAMIEALPKPEDVDTTDEEQMEALLEQLNAIADFAEEHDIDVSENETLLALMELFQEPMMVDDQENGNYRQVTGTNDQSLSADKAVTDFTFDSGINSEVIVSSQAVFVNGNTGTVNGTQDSLEANDSRTIKIPNGFKYYNGKTYDVYVKITSNHKLTNINWVCKNSGSSYYTISPGTNGGTSFDYEIWLQDGIDTVTDIDLVAGSCYTASAEGARPWSDDGKIYTNATLNNLKWNDTYTSGNSKISSFWSPSTDDDNFSNKYILGHGTDSEHHVKGGYVRKSGTGGAEMVLGYLVNTANFVIAGTDNDKANPLSSDTQKVPTDKLVVPPETNAKTGYYFAYWTADKAVTLSDGTTIAKGGHITQEQLAAVKATKTGFDGIYFTAHYAAYGSAASSDGTTYYLTTGSGEDTAKVDTVTVNGETVTPDVTIEAKNMEYTGNAYTGSSSVTVSGLENLKKVYPGALPGSVEYYLANNDGSISIEQTTSANSGAASNGAVPVKVGTYYAKVKITSTAGEQYIYDKFEITPLQAKATVTANTGLIYDGTEHELVTTTSVSGGTVKYSVDGGTNWTTEIPKKTDAGSYEVWYYVEPALNYKGVGSADNPGKLTVRVAKKEIIVSVKAEDKIYDGKTDATVTVTDYGEILPADKGKLTVSGLTGTFDNANVGNDKKVTIDSSNMAVSGDAAKNYQVTVPTETTANITKASQAAPAITGENAVTPEAETIDGKNDGKLTKLTDKMEYRLKGTETYTSVPAGATSVYDLPDGVYEIRYKADNNHTESPAAEVTVGQGRKLTITVNPSAESGQQIGYALTTSESTQSWHGGYKVTFTLNKGYKMTSDFAVMVNGEKINLTKNEDGTYTFDVTDMEENHVVTLQGVSKNSKKHKHSSSLDESDTTVSPSSSATLTASPQTGDSNMPFFWSIMTMLSAVILAGAGILFRRRKIK